MGIARIVVDVATRGLSEPFDYVVPEALDGAAVVGAPVLVPFGPQTVVGYVVERVDSSAHERLREVAAVLGEPLFGAWAPALAAWVAREYVASLAEALRLFLPPGGAPKVVRILRACGPAPARGVRAAVHAAVVAAGELDMSRISAMGPSASAAASALVAQGALARTYRLAPPAVGEVDDRWASLVPRSTFSPAPRATMQRAVLDALVEGPVRVSELAAQLGAVDAAVRRLEELGAVQIEHRRRLRTPHAPERPAPRHEHLTAGQEASLAAIDAAPPGGTVLLRGVTGSGKTEVYLRAIEKVVTDGRSAIVLVPEIALTPQTVGRFRSRFGDAVAVLHSRLSPGERYDQWDRVRTGEATVIVGPRSALFAPAGRIGLVVIDEEHESSYKQGSAPRYHARDVAERLCQATGAVLVLGSATPSLESLENARAGRSVLVDLPQRVAGAQLPAVTVVDMTVEFRDGHRSMFSRPLLAALEEVRDNREKAVLLMNRRGFASFVLCRDCGFVPSCPECSVSMTYHEVGSRLECHHCGATSSLPVACPRCGSVYLRQFGAGTQRVEAELTASVPGLPVVRMDLDTTRLKGGHQLRLAEFEALPSGVLLGTQMIAKGLDYPDVTLVGVVNADTTLHLPDFRATERTYQLLEQVAGRAGRSTRPGRVVLQTYWPDNPAIVAVGGHDPARLYESQRAEREALGYPPFGRLANITFTGRDAEQVRLAATAFAAAVRGAEAPRISVLGPAPAVIARLRGSYRWHVLVKAPAGFDLPAVVRDALAAQPQADGVAVAPDVDPLDLM